MLDDALLFKKNKIKKSVGGGRLHFQCRPPSWQLDSFI